MNTTCRCFKERYCIQIKVTLHINSDSACCAKTNVVNSEISKPEQRSVKISGNTRCKLAIRLNLEEINFQRLIDQFRKIESSRATYVINSRVPQTTKRQRSLTTFHFNNVKNIYSLIGQGKLPAIHSSFTQ